MQGLQELWDIPLLQESWATSGYLGAINSGQATCGLLIGCSVAIGLRAGRGKTCFPLEDEKARDQAVREVHLFYEDFIHEFKATLCRDLIECDLSQPSDAQRYMNEKVYEDKCFKFFEFVMNRFIGLEQEEMATV